MDGESTKAEDVTGADKGKSEIQSFTSRSTKNRSFHFSEVLPSQSTSMALTSTLNGTRNVGQCPM